MRLTSEIADLWFGPTHKPVGFTSGVLAQFDGSTEPVVRELIQNSIDAADQAGRPAEVEFIICEVPRTELPGLQAYEAAFQEAVEYRRRWHRGKPSHDERMVVDRITSALNSETIPLLLCLDNGHGLNGRRMDALLTPGNTSKGDHGAGSFGLGHHAAFGASNLRYVLYGARYLDKRRLREIASGHAILASHRGPNDDLRAADGYWFRTGQVGLAFDGSHENYPEIVPTLLDQYLDNLFDTGTAVCIAGFNDFHRDGDDPLAVESICRVAAANFSDAVHSDRLLVSVRDERVNLEKVEITRDVVLEALEPIKTKRRAEKQGQISGSRAYDAARTLRSGEQIEGTDECTIRWRPLSDDDRSDRQVHVFRKGMWITSRAPGLIKGDFSDTEPFDAVLSLDSGQLEALVRNAEGPEHRGLDKRRLNRREKKDLRDLIAGVADLLRDAVGERQDLKEFIPKGFATLQGQLNRDAETVHRPRAPRGGGSKKRPATRGEKETHSNTKKPRKKGTPRPGSAPSYRSAFRATGGDVTIQAFVDYEDQAKPGSQIGIRVRAASGSDGSCEKPLRDSYLPMVRVADDLANVTRAGEDSGELELLLPAKTGSRELTITLNEPIDDPVVLELDIVRRGVPKKTITADSSASGAEEPDAHHLDESA